MPLNANLLAFGTPDKSWRVFAVFYQPDSQQRREEEKEMSGLLVLIDHEENYM
ncbi:MAG: hypothetical protein QME52_01835 [Bacteroidota bacterium]|nr:hypothetical protein [Bacteroidota bacterium]